MSFSTIARSLEPLAAAMWGLFLGWTIILGAVWVGGVNEGWLRTVVPQDDLRLALVALAQSAVPTWLALAVVNIHLALSHAEGLSTARRWLFLLLAATLALGMLARIKGLPFGPGDFKDTLGPRLLGVPVGWALLWVLLVVGARELVLWARPRLRHESTALAGAALVLLSFVNLQPLVVDGREGFRFWYHGTLASPTGAPWWAALSVFAVAAALGWLLREIRLGVSGRPRSRKPALAFLLFNVLLLLTHVRLWIVPLHPQTEVVVPPSPATATPSE